MKKYLFLIVTIFSIFFITDKVSALSFSAPNNQEITVDSEEKLLDYYYFSKIYNNNDYSNFIFASNSTYYYFIMFDDNVFPYYFTDKRIYLSDGINNIEFKLYRIKKDFTTPTSTNSTGLLVSDISYSTVDIYDSSDKTNIYFNSNISTSDIEKKYLEINKYKITYYLNNEIYKEIEVEEGSSHELLTYDFNKNTHTFSGWQYNENIDLTNITSDIIINATLVEKELIPVYIEFPINKNEFYVLLVEVGVLIMIIFLKWCFPFKGGSDLR